MHSSSTRTRIPQKPVNSFLFVLSRWCKNSSRAKSTLIKAPPPYAFGMFTYQTATALLTCCKVHVTAFVSVVSRFLLRSFFNIC